MPQAVILNGVGSVGKSSTARALPAIITRPFLRVTMADCQSALPNLAALAAVSPAG
jgi:chloramphenicol 3-O phosphotransferase